MSQPRPQPLALLAGVVFVALVVIAFVVLGGNTPELKESGQKVASFYSDNNGRQQGAAFVLAVSALFAAIFVGHLYPTLRWASPESAWPGVALVGGIVAIAGFLAGAGVHLALAEAADKGFAPDALRTLNALDSDLFIPFAGGMAILMVGSGAALVGSRMLPRWLGWVGIVVGVLGFTPAGFFAFILSGVWVLVLSVLCFRALSREGTAATPGAAVT